MAVHGDRPKVRRMKELGQGAAAGLSEGAAGEPSHEAGAEPSDGAAAGLSEGAAGEPSYEAGAEPSNGAAAGHSEGAAGEPSYGVAEVRVVDLPPVDNEVTVVENGDQSLSLTPDLGRCTSMISFHSCSHLVSSFGSLPTGKIFLLGQCCVSGSIIWSFCWIWIRIRIQGMCEGRPSHRSPASHTC
jgi:hypothetical protein